MTTDREVLSSVRWVQAFCDEQGCGDSLKLEQVTAHQPPQDPKLAEAKLTEALIEACVSLGWRQVRVDADAQGRFYCPTHVVVRKLVCAGCLLRAPACSCLGGPGFEAVEGILQEGAR